MNTKFIAIDAGTNVFSCGKCGFWKAETGLSLYVPRDPEALKEKYSLDSVEELSEREFVMPWDLAEEYKVLKRYIHKCSKCGSRMRRLSEKEMCELPCPKCGGKPEHNGPECFIDWD